MDFTLPPHLVDYLAELDAFIEAEIKPLEQQDDNIRFFDHRREYERTDWEAGGLPKKEWEALLGEARKRADAAGHLRYGWPKELGGKGGSQLDLAKYKGQVVMINFWASWCGPCRQEMPLLENIYKKYNKMGFTLIGVNVEPDSKAAEGFLKQTPVSFPVIYDKDSTVSKAYDVSGMPSTVIIDRKGNLRMLHRGYKPGDENEYLDSIRTLVRE